MNKLIQLQEKEYNELFEKANMADSEIVRLAEEMYKEKGAFEISISLSCEQNFEGTIKVRSYAYVDATKRFPISYEDRRVIVDYTERRVLAMMERKFGNQIRDKNVYSKKIELMRSWKIRFLGLSMFGWIAALALTLIFLLK